MSDDAIVDASVVVSRPTGFTDHLVRQMFFEKVMGMRPDNLLVGLRNAGLRTQLCGDPLPVDATVNGAQGLTAKEVLSGLRVQLAAFLETQEQPVRRRVRYMFQTQLLSRELRKRLGCWVGMTFLPGGDLDEFPSGTTFWDAERLEVASVGIRTDRQREYGSPRLCTHFDFRVLGIDIDRDSEQLHVGGVNTENKINRVKLSSSLAFEPGSHQLGLPEDRWDYLDQALEMFEQVEMAEARRTQGQVIPRFPQIFLGFSQDMTVTPEPSEGLKARAYSRVLAWLRNGSPRVTDDPDFGWAAGLQGDLIMQCPWTLSGWDAVERIDPDDANAILLHTWQSGCYEHDGLQLVPATFFQQNSVQAPFKSARRVLLDMEHFLNRRSFNFDGSRLVVPGKAKIQKLALVEPEVPPYGEVGHWHYDLGCGSPGLEELFG